MNFIISIFKKIFSGISSAVKWLTQDDPRLREAKARSLGQPDDTETSGDSRQDVKEYIDPWEEIDNFRSNMLLGRWSRKYKIGSMGKLKKELKGDVDEELRKGKEKQG